MSTHPLRLCFAALLNLMSLGSIVLGQAWNAGPETPHLWAVGTPNGVALQWTLPVDRPLPFSYTVSRSPSGKDRFQTVGRVTRLREEEWKSLLLHVQPDSLQSMINIASSERAPLDIRNKACSKLATMAIIEPSAYVLVLGLSFSDTSCKFSTPYDYRVSTEGHILAELTAVWPGRSPAPSAPSRIQAKPDVGCIHFSWSTDSALQNGIRGCNIYRRSSPDAVFTKLNKTAAISLFRSGDRNAFTFFDDCGLLPGKEYEYVLSSVDVFGRESLKSSILSVRPLGSEQKQVYRAPRITHTDIAENRVTIHWKIFTDSSIAGFNLYRSTWGNTNKSLVNPQLIGPEVRSYNDFLGDVPADFIAYSIASVDKNGIEGRLSYDYRTPIVDLSPPLNADYIECSRSADVVHLRWSPSSSRDLHGFELQRSEYNDGPYQTIMELSSQHEFDDTVRAFASKSLWYRMRSTDLRGNSSAWSEPVHAFSSMMKTIVAPTPMAASPQARLITISWYPSPSPFVSGYIVNRYEDTTRAPRTLNVEALSSNTTQFTDSTVIPLRSYWYELVCTDSSGDFSQPSPRVRSRALLSKVPSRDIKEWIYLRQRPGGRKP